MMARQRLLYETAFDSRVTRKDSKDLDGLAQSSLLLSTTVARAASRSSFGSTSSSSASSTPTHLSMDIALQRFTPTERRRVTLIHDRVSLQSISPQASSKLHPQKSSSNQNCESKISLTGHWDSMSRDSSSDRSSSQESMTMELSVRSCGMLSDERHHHVTSKSPSNWKKLTSSAKLENSSDSQKNANNCVFQQEDDSVSLSDHSGVKVLPVNSRHCFTKTCKGSGDISPDHEFKENNIQMSPDVIILRRPPSGLLSEIKSTCNVQRPENDHRTSKDYDPPWDLKIGLNGSVSVPEHLSGRGQLQMTTSVTHEKLLEVEETKDGPTLNKPNKPASRPNLNLSLGDGMAMRQKNLTLDFGCSALGIVGKKVDSQLTLQKQGWYHGSISRVEAEGKLRMLREGSYLVRNSESSKHDYSLSLRSARGFMHMKIVPTGEGRFILGQFSNPFANIPEMIQHYSINKLPIKGAEHMSLLYPVIEQLL